MGRIYGSAAPPTVLGPLTSPITWGADSGAVNGPAITFNGNRVVVSGGTSGFRVLTQGTGVSLFDITNAGVASLPQGGLTVTGNLSAGAGAGTNLSISDGINVSIFAEDSAAGTWTDTAAHDLAIRNNSGGGAIRLGAGFSTDASCFQVFRSNGGGIGLTGSNPFTLGEAANLVFGTVTGTKLGTAIGQKIGMYGVTPVAQRSGAAQAAVATTGSTNVTPFGFTTAAQADALVTLANELRAALVALGPIKGSA